MARVRRNSGFTPRSRSTRNFSPRTGSAVSQRRTGSSGFASAMNRGRATESMSTHSGSQNQNRQTSYKVKNGDGSVSYYRRKNNENAGGRPNDGRFSNAMLSNKQHGDTPESGTKRLNVSSGRPDSYSWTSRFTDQNANYQAQYKDVEIEGAKWEEITYSQIPSDREAAKRPSQAKPEVQQPEEQPEKQPEKQQTGSQQAGNQQAGNQQAENQRAGSQQAGSQQAGSQQAGSQQAGSQQAENQQAGNEQAGNEQSKNQKVEEQPAKELPVVEQPVVEQPAEEKPAEEKPAEEKPAEEKPAEEQQEAEHQETELNVKNKEPVESGKKREENTEKKGEQSVTVGNGSKNSEEMLSSESATPTEEDQPAVPETAAKPKGPVAPTVVAPSEVTKEIETTDVEETTDFSSTVKEPLDEEVEEKDKKQNIDPNEVLSGVEGVGGAPVAPPPVSGSKSVLEEKDKDLRAQVPRPGDIVTREELLAGVEQAITLVDDGKIDLRKHLDPNVYSRLFPNGADFGKKGYQTDFGGVISLNEKLPNDNFATGNRTGEVVLKKYLSAVKTAVNLEQRISSEDTLPESGTKVDSRLQSQLKSGDYGGANNSLDIYSDLVVGNTKTYSKKYSIVDALVGGPLEKELERLDENVLKIQSQDVANDLIEGK